MKSDAIWAQVLKAPADQTLRGKYELALRVEKDPRAAVFPAAADVERFPAYYVQHDAMMRKYEEALRPWRAAMLPLEKKWNAEVRFVGGWPVELTLAARDFATHAAEIVGAMPLRHLNLREVAAADDVFGLRELEQIASLNGSATPWNSAAVRSIAQSEHVGALRWLSLQKTGITDADVDVLAASMRLRGVQHLDVQNNPCRDPVDASMGYGSDWQTGIVPESIYLPEFGKELEKKYGRIGWLHALGNFMEKHPPSRYSF
jgi:hypothetical protein